MDTLLTACATALSPSAPFTAAMLLAQVDPVTLGASKLTEYGAIGLLALCALYALKVMWKFASEQAAGRLADRDKHQEKYERLLESTIGTLTQVRGSLDAVVVAAEEDAHAEPMPAPKPASLTGRNRKQTE